MTAGDIPVLSVTDVSLSIDGVRILDHVTLDVPRGELLVLIGPNGAGKTSLINVLSGAMTPSSGTVRIGTHDVTRWAPHRRARAGVGRTFQTSNLFVGRTVHENVRLAAVAGRLTWRNVLRPARPTTELAGNIAAHLELVGLAGRAGDLAANLSHGDRRKLEMAMVLISDPEVILLDEPMAGVNTDDVPGLVELIKKVHRDKGVTIVMVEHHMHVVLDLAQRIAVLVEGALLAADAPDKIVANATVQAAYVGEPL
ncbi:ABC transporter ATP-binding protein [Gordonia sp. NPDC058843]|uniref:ABC transporter ATP-binding protein n=1 Tax=Gordonia sp. NPDC058843 TaxID=3346648 RepID=UPI0036B83DEB